MDDVSSFSHRRLSTILKDTSHPHHAAAKAEMDRRKQTESTVNEVSQKKLSDYMRASSADVPKARGNARRQDKRIGGQKMADEKLRKKQGYGSSAKVAAESTQIDEISVGKLSDYAKAASKDIEQKRMKVKNALGQPASVKHAKAGADAMKGLVKRSRGSDAYVDKMTGRSKVKPTAEATDLDTVKKILEKSKGLWANIHAKRKRGEKPNPPGHPDRPSAEDLKRSQK